MRITRLCVAAAVWGLVSLTTTAQADRIEGWYLSGGGVFSTVDNRTYDLVGAPVIAHPAELDDDLGFFVAGGYGFDGLRLELEYGRRKNEVDRFGRVGGVGPGEGELAARTLMANLVYDFELTPRLLPYAGVGIGRTRVEADGIQRDTALPDRTGIIDGDGSAFAWQLLVGFAFQATEKLDLMVDFRWLDVGDTELDYGIGCVPDTGVTGTGCVFTSTLEDDYDGRSVFFGLRWRFGQP